MLWDVLLGPSDSTGRGGESAAVRVIAVSFCERTAHLYITCERCIGMELRIQRVSRMLESAACRFGVRGWCQLLLACSRRRSDLEERNVFGGDQIIEPAGFEAEERTGFLAIQHLHGCRGL